MTDAERTRAAFEASGAIRRGHFRVPAGQHTGEFWEKFALLQRPALASQVIALLAHRLEGLGATHVAGPSQGGLVLAFELARQLDLPAVFVEKSPSPTGFVVQRGTALGRGDRLIAVDDLISSAGTLSRLLVTLRATGAEVLVAAALIDRRPTVASPSELAVPVQALLELHGPPSWEPSACPLCAAGEPLLDPRTMGPLEDRVQHGQDRP